MNNSLYEVLKLKQNFRKKIVVTDKTPFFVRSILYSSFYLFYLSASDRTVLSVVIIDFIYMR